MLRRFYHGWIVVAATIVMLTLIVGSTFSSYSLYVLPVAEEFKLSRADANSGVILLNLGVAAVSPFLGRLLDRMSARYVMVAASVAFAAAMVVIANSHSLWLTAAVLALVLPFGFQGAGPLVGPVLIARWFTAHRTRAMVISQIGFSVGGLVVPPVVAALIEAQGWRNALMIVGLATGTVLLALALTLRERPGPDDREVGPGIEAAPASVSASAPLKVAAILGSAQLWTITFGCGSAVAMGSALVVSFVPVARAEGLSTLEGASLISLMSGCGIAAKLVYAVFADRIDKILLMAAIFLLGAAVYAALHLSDSYAVLIVSAGVLGVIGGVTSPTFFALLADRFGPASFGTASGLAVPINAILGLVAIRYAGEVFDRTGGYDFMFVSFVALHVLAAALIFATKFTRNLAERAAAEAAS